MPEQYLWSSYNRYIGNQKADKWLAHDFILGYFGKSYTNAQKQYRYFVTRLVGQEYKNPFDEVTGSALLGDQDFVNYIRKKYFFVTNTLARS